MKKTKSLMQWCIDNQDMNLVEQWDEEKNRISADEVGYGCGTKYNWKCKKGHEWHNSPNNRTRKKSTKCPYCEKRKPSAGYNLKTEYPKIAKQLHQDNEKRAEELLPTSHYRAKWICDRGHITELAVRDKVNHPGCRKCKKENNNVERNYPELVKEWHPYYNYPKLPVDYSYASSDKVWWRCSKNIHHNWPARISNRTINKRGCPFCKDEQKTSFYEQSIFYYVKKIFCNAENRYVLDDIGEVDIFIPSKKICIEYNSSYRHKERIEQDTQKYKKMLKENKVICIQDYKAEIDGVIEIYSYKNAYIHLENAINILLKMLDNDNKISVNLKRDEIKILNQYKKNVIDDNFTINYPYIAKEWHPTLNLNLLPEMFKVNTINGFWWKCSKNEKHIWNTSIANRVKNGSGCPFCSGLRASKENNLLKKIPQVKNIWHPTLNTLKPNEVMPYSEKKAYFIQNDGSVKFEKICNVTSRLLARKKKCEK